MAEQWFHLYTVFGKSSYNQISSEIDIEKLISLYCNKWQLNHCKSYRNTSTNKYSLHNQFKAVHININSLRAHCNLLKNYLSQNLNPQVIAISESQLPSSLEVDPRIILDNYRLVRKDRSGFGGGVALYIHNSFKFELLYENTTTWTEEHTFPEYIIG